MAGGGSSRNQTVSQTNEPPEYIRPYLNEAATRSQWALYDGPQQYYPGQTVVPFAGETEQALSGTAARATTGSPVNQAAGQFAQNRLTQPITSQFGGATNPHLDAAFNRGADQVQNRLQTSFAGSGRNIDAARNPAAQEMNDLASRIYGGAYESERDRMAADIGQQRAQQTAVLGMAPGIANQDYVDLERLRGVGAEREDFAGRQMEDAAARWDFNQNAGDINLDQYISRLQGMPGSSMSTNTPIYRNQVAGGLGGAYLGSQIGSQFGQSSGGYGGWGALVGGLAGLLGG